MKEIYRRKLCYSESRCHYIKVSKKYRDMFPPTGEPFTLFIDDQKIDVEIGSLNRIWASLFWGKLPHFRGGDTIVFSKNPDGSFNVSIKG